MGKSTISMAIFNCYVSSPEGMSETMVSVKQESLEERFFSLHRKKREGFIPAAGTEKTRCFFWYGKISLSFWGHEVNEVMGN